MRTRLPRLHSPPEKPSPYRACVPSLTGNAVLNSLGSVSYHRFFLMFNFRPLRSRSGFFNRFFHSEIWLLPDIVLRGR